MTPKLYTLTLLAIRENRTDIQVRGEAIANTVLTVQTSTEDAEAEGWRLVHERFPQVDGWFEHQATAFELPDQIPIDEYQVTLTIIKNEAAS
jgi:hypothetical protein